MLWFCAAINSVLIIASFANNSAAIGVKWFSKLLLYAVLPMLLPSTLPNKIEPRLSIPPSLRAGDLSVAKNFGSYIKSFSQNHCFRIGFVLNALMMLQELRILQENPNASSSS
jgi:hypothetical protein